MNVRQGPPWLVVQGATQSNAHNLSLLRLTLLAPDLVETIVDDRVPSDAALPRLLETLPTAWKDQRAALGARILAEGDQQPMAA